MSYNCPICKKELEIIPRYPKYVCRSCAAKATDKNGRKLIFSNIDMTGGFIASFEDNNECYDSHTCYIEGTECRADEAKFGGIVIEKV